MKKKILKSIMFVLSVAVCVLLLCFCGRHTHRFVKSAEIKSPTCTESGIQKVTCSCGAEEEQSVEPLGHRWEKKVTVAATCTQDGAYRVECEACGELSEEGKIASHGHNIIRHEARKATCKDVGWKAYEACSNCDYSNYVEIPRIAHTSSGDADCVTAESCIMCGEILKEALGHTEKTVSGRKATCSRSGLSDGKICSVCDAVLVEQIAVPKTEHTPEVIVGKAATCTSTGISEGMRCTECRYVTVEPIEIPERSHTYSGSLDTNCDICGFKRSVGADACIHENQTTSKKIASDCEGCGLTQGVLCDDCGEVLVQQEVIAAKEHEEKTVKGYAATCVLPGLSDGGECYYCEAVISPQEIIVPDGHIEIEDKPVSPTCADAGLTVGRHCAACQERTLKQNRIEPLGHNKVEYEGKAATCTESGWLPYYTCSECSYSSFEKLERTSHTEVIDPAIPATCESAGLTEGKHCSLCGTVTKKQSETEAIGHSYGAWKSVKAGGCTDERSSVRVCTQCFLVEGKNGAQYHEFKAICEFEDCTDYRELVIECEKCNADGGSEIIEPIGHDLIWSVTASGHSVRCDREGCRYYKLTEAHKASGSRCDDRVCVDCGHTVSLGVGHKLSARYEGDANYHWNECTNAGCDYETDREPHTNPSAKCTDRTVKCAVCSKYYSPQMEHSMGAWYAASGTTKRRDCSHCDYYETRFEN